MSTDPTIDPLTTSDWWRHAMGYQIYIRSFADSNADGVGDLAGITTKLDYLADLGVDVVWITPFFPTPGFDQGYDVSDYVDVDPLFGSLADWDALVIEARRLGLRLFVDIVPNHTSSHHRWFQEAVNDPRGPFRDYYVWADPGVDGGPPNNWVSHFGGPAWTLDPGGSGQFYCHLFLPEQPDLNWGNPKVMDEFAAILHFWADRGADGFRIDVAHGLTKDPDLRDNPQIRPIHDGMHPTEVFESFEHRYDLHRSETAVLFRKWRDAVQSRGSVLLGEMDTRNVDRFAEYVAGGDALHGGFVLQIGLTDWHPAAIIDALSSYQTNGAGGCAWEVSNHDQARAVSRYGGGGQGLRRTLALTALMTGLDGLVFVYQGEELGVPDAVLLGDPADPVTTRNAEGTWGRDVARGPVPWNTQPVNGFTTAPHAWLHTAEQPRQLTAEFQRDNVDSTWHRYRNLLHLRKRHATLTSQPARLERPDPGVLVIRRGDMVVVGNLSGDAFAVPWAGELVFATGDECTADVIPAETTAVIRETAP